MKKEYPCTWEIVQYAMKVTSKDVRQPKCVRDGLVKPIIHANQQPSPGEDQGRFRD